MRRGSAATPPRRVRAPESVMPWLQYAVAATRIHSAGLRFGLASAENDTRRNTTARAATRPASMLQSVQIKGHIISSEEE
jgi:hypothetical protein